MILLKVFYYIYKGFKLPQTVKIKGQKIRPFLLKYKVQSILEP